MLSRNDIEARGDRCERGLELVAGVGDELLLLLDVVFNGAYGSFGEYYNEDEYENEACDGDRKSKESQSSCELELPAGVEEDQHCPVVFIDLCVTVVADVALIGFPGEGFVSVFGGGVRIDRRDEISRDRCCIS